MLPSQSLLYTLDILFNTVAISQSFPHFTLPPFHLFLPNPRQNPLPAVLIQRYNLIQLLLPQIQLPVQLTTVVLVLYQVEIVALCDEVYVSCWAGVWQVNVLDEFGQLRFCEGAWFLWRLFHVQDVDVLGECWRGLVLWLNWLGDGLRGLCWGLDHYVLVVSLVIVTLYSKLVCGHYSTSCPVVPAILPQHTYALLVKHFGVFGLQIPLKIRLLPDGDILLSYNVILLNGLFQTCQLFWGNFLKVPSSDPVPPPSGLIFSKMTKKLHMFLLLLFVILNKLFGFDVWMLH